ncbi:MAG: arylsulfatase [Methylococcus sp.]
MNRHLFLVLLAFAALIESPHLAAAVEKPNIVFILMDNLGYGELGIYGGGALRGATTPRIDQLANQGLRLTNMNMEPQCTPSRSSIMTGRFALRSGTYAVSFGSEHHDGLTPWEVTIAEALSASNYATALFGKWHLGSNDGRLPNDQGFDEWFGIPRTSDEALWPSDPNYNPDLTPPEYVMEGVKGQPSKNLRVYDLFERSVIDSHITKRSVDYINHTAASGRPFFLMVSYTQPHFPTLPNPHWKGVSHNGDWADMLKEMDHNVGQILDAISAAGIQNDTIVIFTSDNGAEYLKPWDGWAGPWRGAYFTAQEGGIRVPFIIRWPGKIAPRRVSDSIMHGVDLYATLAKWTGAKVPHDRPIDSLDQSKFLLGSNKQSAREGFPIWNADLMLAVKWRQYKMHFFRQDTMVDPPERLYIPAIYNLYTSPREEKGALETWVTDPVHAIVECWEWALAKCPLIPMGAPDTYQPPSICTPPFFPDKSSYFPNGCKSVQ